LEKTAPSTGIDGDATAPPAGFVRRFWAWIVLLFLGVVWGYSFSLAKMAMAGGAHPFGVTLWTSLIGAGLLIALSAARRRPISLKSDVMWLYIVCGLLGTVVPSILFFYAASKVPAGVLSITVTVVPILTFLFAALLGLERFASLRVLGVVCGAVAVMLLVGPETSLPDPSAAPWVLLACGAGVCYAVENMILTLRMPQGVSPFMMTCGMFIAAAVMLTPVVIVTDSFVPLIWPWGQVEWAIIGMGAISAVAYGLFIYLISYAGPVFASQTAYTVTVFGVIWGMLIFGERHSVWIWLSLFVMMIGFALVMPRRHKRAAE
jgi:drug/metabolite transporter (DMT)-like permease